MKKYRKMFFLIIFSCINPFFIKAQDKIHKTDSTVIEAKVIEISDTEIKYKKFSNPNGPSYVVDKSKVVMIVYENGEKDIFIQDKASHNVQDEPTKLIQVTPIYDTIKQQKPKAVIPGSKSQKGTIKIFSELKGINVYLDDIYKGTDITIIDSVTTESHYLKIIKEKVIIYGELINVNANTPTSVLLKDTKEIQDKMLSSKFKEQETYKSSKLDVMLDTKYITQTTGKTNSIYFPGYYSALGVSKSNSISVTSSSTDWFFTQGRNTKISELQFATITKNQTLKDEIMKSEKSSKTINNVGGALALGGLVVGFVGVIDLAAKKPWINNSVNLNAGLIAGGVIGFLIGIGLANASNESHGHFITFQNSVVQVNIFNQNLKKSLGLPENYEP